jgi:hypothetical protein
MSPYFSCSSDYSSKKKTKGKIIAIFFVNKNKPYYKIRVIINNKRIKTFTISACRSKT